MIWSLLKSSPIAVVLILVPVHLSAESICRLGQLERRISVDYERPPAKVPCQVRYEKKPGADISFPWRAVREIGYCEARATALAEKFEALGWSCERFDPKPDSARAPSKNTAIQREP